MFAKQFENVNVQVIATDKSLSFYDPELIRKGGTRVWTDKDEWRVIIPLQFFVVFETVHRSG